MKSNIGGLSRCEGRPRDGGGDSRSKSHDTIVVVGAVFGGSEQLRKVREDCSRW